MSLCLNTRKRKSEGGERTKHKGVAARRRGKTSKIARGIEWSLRTFAKMRAVRLFLRARAAINFLMQVASTLEITNSEQRQLEFMFS